MILKILPSIVKELSDLNDRVQINVLKIIDLSQNVITKN